MKFSSSPVVTLLCNVRSKDFWTNKSFTFEAKKYLRNAISRSNLLGRPC